MKRHVSCSLRHVATPSARYSTYRQLIAERNASINAFVSVSEPPQPATSLQSSLAGLTIAVKDNIATKDLPTTCSSAMLKEFTSPFDATVITLLRNAGADIVGKTNCDEFGMGSLNVHSIHGPVKNPVNISENKSPGGSSGGSAAAVAAGMCDVALGTDTGGSVRLPASYCGVSGFKPSYGLISRWGVVSYADSLDCVGLLASTTKNLGRVFKHIASYDPKDPTSAPIGRREKAARIAEERVTSIRSSLKGLRVGIPEEYFPSELSNEIIRDFRSALHKLEKQGAEIFPVSLPSTRLALSSYYVLASAEASSNLARYDSVQYGSFVKPSSGTDISKISTVYAHSRTAGFGSEVQKRILLGTYGLSAAAFDNYFLQAQRIRQLIKDDFDRVFAIPNQLSDRAVTGNVEGAPQIDVLLHPTAIQTAPSLSESTTSEDLNTYVQDIMTVPASLAGLPALSVPMSNTETGWPIGLSIVGQWGTDDLVLQVGACVENALEYKPSNKIDL